VEVEFNEGLRLHAARRDDVDNVGDEIDTLRRSLELGKENCEDATDAGQNLHEVVESNDPVVARIGVDASLLHKVDPGGRDGEAAAEQCLTAQQRNRARTLAWTAALFRDVSANISLAALVASHITIECRVAEIADAAVVRWPCSTNTRETALCAVARSVAHVRLPRSGIVIVLDEFLAGFIRLVLFSARNGLAGKEAHPH